MPANPTAPTTYGATPGPRFVLSGGGVAVASSGALFGLDALGSDRAAAPASGGQISNPSASRARFPSTASESGVRLSALDAPGATFAAAEPSADARVAPFAVAVSGSDTVTVRLRAP